MVDTVDGLIAHHAASMPDKPLVIDPDCRRSYAEIDSSTAALAAALICAGVGKGSRVGLIAPNGVPWVQIAIAVTRMGAVLVPLSTLLTARELTTQLRTASVQFLITVDEFRGHRYRDDLQAHLDVPALGDGPIRLPELPALRRVWTTDALFGLEHGESAARVAAAMSAMVSPADTMAVTFTSGSSGSPKGVLHSHGSAIGAVRAGLEPRCVRSDSRIYLPMPLFWMGGFGGGLLTALVAGATLVTEPTPQPDSTLRLLQRERVTLFRGWPDQAEALARVALRTGADLSSLQPGSLDAVLPADLRSAPGARATLFGMTESFGPYSGYRADTDMPPAAWGSCGKPFAGMEVRIVDTDTGAPLPAGAVGEIQLRGPHTLRGICRRSREEVFTVDGFYPTGDLGLLDDDGFLFYRGRVDDMFKVRGAGVYPSEVADALQTIDGVERAFVTNLSGAQGDRIAAAVVCADGVTAEGLREAARSRLSAFKVPTVWLLLHAGSAVPRGASGKVDVRELRKMLTEHGLETGR